MHLSSELHPNASTRHAHAQAGRSPLLLASRSNHTAVVRLLLGLSPACVEAADSEGNSSLAVAAGHGHLEVCWLLLSAGAAVDAENKVRAMGGLAADVRTRAWVHGVRARTEGQGLLGRTQLSQ